MLKSKLSQLIACLHEDWIQRGTATSMLGLVVAFSPVLHRIYARILIERLSMCVSTNSCAQLRSLASRDHSFSIQVNFVQWRPRNSAAFSSIQTIFSFNFYFLKFTIHHVANMTVCESQVNDLSMQNHSLNRPSFMITDILSKSSASGKSVENARKNHHEFNQMTTTYDSDGDASDDVDCRSVGSSG